MSKHLPVDVRMVRSPSVLPARLTAPRKIPHKVS